MKNQKINIRKKEDSIKYLNEDQKKYFRSVELTQKVSLSSERFFRAERRRKC